MGGMTNYAVCYWSPKVQGIVFTESLLIINLQPTDDVTRELVRLNCFSLWEYNNYTWRNHKVCYMQNNFRRRRQIFFSRAGRRYHQLISTKIHHFCVKKGEMRQSDRIQPNFFATNFPPDVFQRNSKIFQIKEETKENILNNKIDI